MITNDAATCLKLRHLSNKQSRNTAKLSFLSYSTIRATNVETHIKFEEGGVRDLSEILSLVSRLDVNETIVRTCATDASHYNEWG